MLGRLDDKDEKRVIIGCECGCNRSINIIRDENDFYIELTAGLFYERYHNIFKIIGRRIKLAFFMLLGKEYKLYDITVKESDIDKLIELLKEISYGK